ncbi:hypothetical protein [Parachitinimonas caeni]|uniref:Uncharacterized protein n=1 Tax=Parachitinimonas caeni TaxID=3031301 RepID=A0ABT7DRN2_9NEIS|nr:hypothetical protein [Parachitinimonas caeni]MDK2122711.1 hypothetical protein [Parachitinimonas caeni]
MATYIKGYTPPTVPQTPSISEDMQPLSLDNSQQPSNLKQASLDNDSIPQNLSDKSNIASSSKQEDIPKPKELKPKDVNAQAQGVSYAQSFFGATAYVVNSFGNWSASSSNSFSQLESRKAGLSAEWSTLKGDGDFTSTVLSKLDGVFASGTTFVMHNGKNSETTGDHALFRAALLSGAHVIVEDGGALHKEMLTAAKDANQKVGTKGSSHHPNGSDQCRLPLALNKDGGELLMGKTASGDTWFQLEKFGADSSGHFGSDGYMGHVASSSEYVQVGPFGNSKMSEKDGNHMVVIPNKD